MNEKMLRNKIKDCFRLSDLQTAGDTELFDTEMIIESIVDLFRTEIERERREAFDRGLKAEQSRHVVQAGMLQQELNEIKNALSVLANLTSKDTEND